MDPDLLAEQLLGYQTHSPPIRPDNLIVLKDRHLPWDAPALPD